MNDERVTPSVVIRPKILYYGTPVVLITTRNEDGSTNISPMSSSWGLGDHVVLGMLATGQGLENLRRERECVVNVPDARLWESVERLAPTTGARDVPSFKREIGYRYDPDKFGTGDFTPAPSDLVKPPRIAECPLQLEAAIEAVFDRTLATEPSRPRPETQSRRLLEWRERSERPVSTRSAMRRSA
jgi:flavin reductase (DIM6/NTAB) family NADH-FMN oxidoreductase RutF